MVDARVWRQVKDEARESPVTLLQYPSPRISVVASRHGSKGQAGKLAAGGLTTTHVRLWVNVLWK
jgi:hypothetical protein